MKTSKQIVELAIEKGKRKSNTRESTQLIAMLHKHEKLNRAEFILPNPGRLG